ncbi:hypothetical protein LOK49_LG12G02682 [Camellia lanceoleosa]|uniref:Uncharacterized protein n=1 Tax=Camellia lanceoleosa TaxID=1840588 RepID=A0ACC0FSZ3_9ERIC|nr:hypothetical protein LOK49_LG12G02682 [Camellia lanceoleosa]
MLLNLRRANALRVRVPILSPLQLYTNSASPIEPLTKPQLKTLVLSQYRHGKFFNLLQNVVASPSLLLSACHNLTPRPSHNNATEPSSSEPLNLNWVSDNFFSVDEIATQLAQNRFDIESCCVAVHSSRNRGLYLGFITEASLWGHDPYQISLID